MPLGEPHNVLLEKYGDYVKALAAKVRKQFGGRLDMDLLTRDFGNPWRMVDPGLIVKRFPAQYTTHWLINAALELRELNRLDPADIERVELEAASDNPAPGKGNPATGLDGKFSAEYTAAIAAASVGVNTPP